jgi:hypothetical protein
MDIAVVLTLVLPGKGGHRHMGGAYVPCALCSGLVLLRLAVAAMLLPCRSANSCLAATTEFHI